MTLPINIAKITPPVSRHVLKRRRLFDRLERGAGCRIVMICGQAAQGKSTLVADYLSLNGQALAWLHLEQGDGDAANFFHLLMSALESVPSLSMDRNPTHSPSDLPEISLGSPDPLSRYLSRLKSIWSSLDQPITLVLDGLDRMAHQAPALHLVQALVDTPHPFLRLFFISRQPPPVMYQRGVLKQEILVVENDELLFTPLEIQAYFKQRHQLLIHETLCERLHHISGGWTGALVLISQALDRLSEADRIPFLEQQLPGRFSRDMLRFFSEEVFNNQPAHIKNFLLQSAMLDVLEPDILNELNGNGDAEALLAELVRCNLFTHRLAGKGSKQYRYNELFSDFLRTQFRNTFSESDRRAWYQLTADLYSRRRKWEIAIRYYHHNQDHQMVARGIKKIAMDFLARGRFNDLAHQLRLLSSEMIREDPWLLFYRTVTRRMQGGMRNLTDFEQALEGFDHADDLRGRILSMAYLIEAQVFLGQDVGSCQDRIHQAEKLLADSSHVPLYTYAKTQLWLQIGLGYIANGVDPIRGQSAGRNAHLMAQKMGDRRLMATAAVVQGLGHTLTGEYDRADLILADSKNRVDTAAFPEYGVLRDIIDLQLTLGRGDMDLAQAKIDQIGPAIEEFGLLFFYPTVIDATGLLKIYQQQYDAAVGVIRHLMDLSTMAGNPIYFGLAKRLTALRHYHQGRFTDALGAAQTAVTDLAQIGQPTLHLMRAKHLLGLNHMHLGQLKPALALINEVLAYFEDIGAVPDAIEAQLSLGLLFDLSGDSDHSRTVLEQGFSRVTRRNWRHPAIMRRDDLVRATRLAAGYQIEVPKEWVAKPLRAQKPARAENPSRQRLNKIGSTTTELPILHLRTFGGFQVIPEGRHPITQKAWAGNRTQLLLKAIVVHGLREIPKEILIDDLWPDSKPSAAAQNFKVTLHRLRKVLEPDLPRGQGSSYLHLKDNRISLNPDLWRVDSALLLQDCKDIKRLLVGGNLQDILKIALGAKETYSGDFLPEEPYTPWVEMKRWALKKEYLAVLTRVTDLLVAQERWPQAIDFSSTILEIDGSREAAARLLMKAYAALKRYHEAVEVYETLQKTLQEELDISPDSATQALKGRIEASRNEQDQT